MVRNRGVALCEDPAQRGAMVLLAVSRQRSRVARITFLGFATLTALHTCLEDATSGVLFSQRRASFSSSAENSGGMTSLVTLSNGMKMPRITFGIAYDFVNAIQLVDALMAGAQSLSIMDHDPAGVRANVGVAVELAMEKGYERPFTILYIQCSTDPEVMLASTGLGYVDIMVLHSPCVNTKGAKDKIGLDASFLVDGKEGGAETTLDKYRSLEALVSSGHAKGLGLSNYMHGEAFGSLKRLLEGARVPPVFHAVPWSVGHHEEDELAFNRAHGLMYQAWSVFGRSTIESSGRHPLVTGADSEMTLFDHPLVKAVSQEAGRSPAQGELAPRPHLHVATATAAVFYLAHPPTRLPSLPAHVPHTHTALDELYCHAHESTPGAHSTDALPAAARHRGAGHVALIGSPRRESSSPRFQPHPRADEDARGAQDGLQGALLLSCHLSTYLWRLFVLSVDARACPGRRCRWPVPASVSSPAPPPLLYHPRGARHHGPRLPGPVHTTSVRP